MFIALMLMGHAQPPITPQKEERIHQTLRMAVEKMAPANPCNLPAPQPTDFLTVVGTYFGGAVPTVTVTGQDKANYLSEIVIAKGANPVYLVVRSIDPVIWKLSGDIGRIRKMIVLYADEAGVVGLPGRRVDFVRYDNCGPPYDIYNDRVWPDEVRIMATFGRRANAVGGSYRLSRAVLDDSGLHVDPRFPVIDHDRIIPNFPAEWSFPHPLSPARPSSLELDFRKYYPAGIVSINPSQVLATRKAERYEVLPSTAGAMQLERSGALVAATAADMNRWINRALVRGKVRADMIKTLDFYSAYKVTRPIKLPAQLCGATGLTLFVPSRSFVRGDRCHTNIYVDDGTIMGSDHLHLNEE